MKRPEIDRTLDEFATACRLVGAEQHKPPGRCDLGYLEALLSSAAAVRNRLHAQIDEIAETAIRSAVER